MLDAFQALISLITSQLHRFHAVVLVNTLGLGWFAWRLTSKRHTSSFAGVLASICVAQIPYYVWIASHSALPHQSLFPGDWVFLLAFVIPMMLAIYAGWIVSKKRHEKLDELRKKDAVLVRAIEVLGVVILVVFALALPGYILVSDLGEAPPKDLAVDRATILTAGQVEELPRLFNDHLVALEEEGRQLFPDRRFATYTIASAPLRFYQPFCWTVRLRAVENKQRRIAVRASYLGNMDRLSPLSQRLLPFPAAGFQTYVPVKTEPDQRIYVVLRMTDPVDNLDGLLTTTAELGRCNTD